MHHKIIFAFFMERQYDWCEISPQSSVSTIPQLVIMDNCGEVWSTVDNQYFMRNS